MEKAMLRSTIRMIIPPENHCDALEILTSVSEQTQFEPGCLCSRVYGDVNDERITLHHLRSEKYRKILLVIEMAAEPPEIRFDTIAQTSGMETIEQARNGRTG
jgi:quinol monooxygenase YgiN